MPCRQDKGLALVRLWHPGAGRVGVIEFGDGKVYQVRPMFARDLALHASRRSQPGCFFNKVLRRRPGFLAERLESWPASADLGGVLADLRQPDPALPRES